MISVHVFSAQWSSYTLHFECSWCLQQSGGEKRLYLHGIKGQVTGDLKLLHEHLLFDVVDADKLGLASSQNWLPIRRVAQRCKRPLFKSEYRWWGMNLNWNKWRGAPPVLTCCTHLPLADCLAVILSVSLRPVSRSWRPATEPVCVALWGFQKQISPLRVATANSWPSGRYVTAKAGNKSVKIYQIFSFQLKLFIDEIQGWINVLVQTAI